MLCLLAVIYDVLKVHLFKLEIFIKPQITAFSFCFLILLKFLVNVYHFLTIFNESNTILFQMPLISFIMFFFKLINLNQNSIDLDQYLFELSKTQDLTSHNSVSIKKEHYPESSIIEQVSI